MPKFCPLCGIWYQYENTFFCPNCGETIQPLPIKHWKKIRNPFFAVIFSFLFVGWGQWYNGKNYGGLKFFGAFLFFLVAMIFFATMTSIQPFAAILFIIMIGIWFYGMYDAYKTAESINKNKESFIRKSRLFWLPVGLCLLLIFAVIAAFIFGKVNVILPGV